MLACRSLFRVVRIPKFTDTYVLPMPVNCYQVRSVYNVFTCNLKMGGSKDMQQDVDCKKKRKSLNPVWRPVSTQASSCEVVEVVVKNVTVESEDGSQVQEVQGSISSHVTREAEGANEITDSATISCSTLQDKNEDRASEGELVASAEKHSISVEVGASLIRFIKGKGGCTQKSLEEEMGVKIVIPSSKEDSVIIEGNSIDNVAKATEKIQAIIDEAVKSPNLDYSHFVSLPLAIHPELVDKLFNFQKSILGSSDPCLDENLDSDSNEDISDSEDKKQQPDKGVKVDRANIPIISYSPKASKCTTSSDLGIDRSIFIKPKTFHLTVLMLKLWNKERVHVAAEVLQRITSKVMDALDNRPVSIRLKGLDCMRGSLAKARVLYAPVEEIGSEDRLSHACQVIIDAFVEAGLVLEKDANQKLKLHATLMNVRHRKRKKRTRKVDFFDARGIFKQYGSEDWGEYLIREAHLSQRFVFDENGYYHCCASIPFPENLQVD